MKKPRNRKERISFLIKKDGTKATQLLVSLTDKEVKFFFDYRWKALKDKPDHIEEPSKCIRCESEVLWHSECGCGEDRAVFDNDSWLDDISNNADDKSWLKEANDEFLKSIKNNT